MPSEKAGKETETMNLEDFLSHFAGETSIEVRCKGEIIFQGTVEKMEEEVSCLYRVIPNGTTWNSDRIMVVKVKKEDEIVVKRRKEKKQKELAQIEEEMEYERFKENMDHLSKIIPGKI